MSQRSSWASTPTKFIALTAMRNRSRENSGVSEILTIGTREDSSLGWALADRGPSRCAILVTPRRDNDLVESEQLRD